MDKEVLKEYRQSMAEHLASGRDYKSFTAIEKFRYADKMMSLTKEYCCSLWGLSPENVYTVFLQGLGKNVGSATNGEGEIAAYGLNTTAVLNSDPLNLYKTCLHEMRHVYQMKILKPGDKETSANYYGISKKLGKFAWASSETEIGADKFAFKEIFKIAGRAMLKTEEKVSSASLFKFADHATTRMFEHKVCSLVYKAVRPFMKDVQERSIMEKIPREAIKTEDRLPVKPVELKDLELLANMAPRVFTVSPKGLDKKDRNEIVSDVEKSIESFYGSREQVRVENVQNNLGVTENAVIGQEISEQVAGNNDADFALNNGQEIAETLNETGEVGETSMSGSDIVAHFKQMKKEESSLQENANLNVTENVTTEAFPPPEA